MSAMITIAEVPEYIRQAEKLMTVKERQDIVSYLAAHPKSGDLIEGAVVFARYVGVEVGAARVVGFG